LQFLKVNWQATGKVAGQNYLVGKKISSTAGEGLLARKKLVD
jgi:hypothetical protein